jgi:hypothetical protein
MCREDDEPPVVVESLVPRDDFIVTQRSYLPYHNPKISSVVVGGDNLRDEMTKWAARQKRVAEEDAKEAAFVEQYKQRERDAYRLGKETTRRTNGTKEKREENVA